MDSAEQLNMNPIEIAEGVFWLGYANDSVSMHCNPYLIFEGDEAVLIDGGSRDDFSYVMLKILRTGLKPAQIKRLIYQHYDPDLCGNLPQMEAIINSEELNIISHAENNVFIHYYSKKTPKLDYRAIDNQFVFQTGRKLEFYGTPFCHAPGSFVTYDTKTKTLFSSDLFGSYDTNWKLFVSLTPDCRNCATQQTCHKTGEECPLVLIGEFHKRIMTSNMALHHALDVLSAIDIECIAPQHGGILFGRENVQTAITYLRGVGDVGIEYYAAENLL
ncbi:MAG: MBL fold metallo-hydrolase [Eubacteriales bacterium]|nr:MBL fold metallo-hydrolase [Eubacteriales bacterium]